MKEIMTTSIFILLVNISYSQSGDPKLISIVEEFAKKLEQLVPEENLDGILDIYSEDAIYAPENDKIYAGKEEIKKAWERALVYDFTEFRMAPSYVYGDKKLIYEVGKGYSRYIINEEEKRFDFKYVNVWRKENDNYKLVIDTYNVFVDKQGS